MVGAICHALVVCELTDPWNMVNKGAIVKLGRLLQTQLNLQGTMSLALHFESTTTSNGVGQFQCHPLNDLILMLFEACICRGPYGRSSQ